MPKTILFYILVSLTAQLAVADCFTIQKAHAVYTSPQNYSAHLEFERIYSKRLFFISHNREGGSEQSTQIFNKIFNLTESSKLYKETKNQNTPFELENSLILGRFSAQGFENLRLCTKHYKINPKNWSIYFADYKIEVL